MTKKEELEAQGYKTYENEDIQVFWKPRICQHAGECEFEASGDRWVIMHTGVREAYKGKGIARKLVLKVIEAARAKGVKILPVCSYSKKLMTGKEEFQDMMFFLLTLQKQVCNDYSGTPHIKSPIERVCRKFIIE